MSKENSNNQKAKILPFRQDIDFFLKRGNIGLEQNDNLKAVSRYRKAYESDNTDLDSCLGLADTLGRMQRYEESNRLLMVDMSMNEPDPEHYFGMASNYYGMQEFGYAKEALETYLKIDPEGAYSGEAMDFLDVLEDEEELAFQTGAAGDETTETLTVCNRARQAMCCGEPELAEKLLREHLKSVPGAFRARNQLAVTCYFLGNKKEAEKLLDGILKEDPSDVHARVSRIVFYETENQKDKAIAAMPDLEKTQLNEPDELSSVGFLQMQLGRYDKALVNLEKLADFMPYDQVVLHQLAMARWFTGDREGACRCYLTLLTADPDDTVAKYYLAACRSEKAEPGKNIFLPAYEVPYRETIDRLHRLEELFDRDAPELRYALEQDRDARNLVSWALNSQEQRHKSGLISLLGAIGGEKAEIMLRDFLLRTDQHDLFKHEALSALRHMKAKDPFMAYLGGQWVMGEVSRVFDPLELPASIKHVLDTLAKETAGITSERLIEGISRAVAVFLDCPDAPFLNKAQQQAMAAAMEYVARVRAGEEPVEKQAMAEKYGVTVRRIDNALDKLGPEVLLEV